VLQVGPDGVRHRVIEGHERFGDTETGAVVLERVRFAGDQSAVLQHGEGVGEVAGLAAEAGGDATAARVTRRDRRQDGVVEAGVAQLGLVGEEVARLAGDRAGRGEDRPHHPVVEVVRVRRGVIASELPAVGGGAADDRVDLHGGGRVVDSPELRGQLVRAAAGWHVRDRGARRWRRAPVRPCPCRGPAGCRRPRASRRRRAGPVRGCARRRLRRGGAATRRRPPRRRRSRSRPWPGTGPAGGMSCPGAADRRRRPAWPRPAWRRRSVSVRPTRCELPYVSPAFRVAARPAGRCGGWAGRLVVISLGRLHPAVAGPFGYGE
jgi:hypothetical protein